MIYKDFDQHITRKHGIIVEGWPLPKFDNPSAIGSQVELGILLRSWQKGATRFRKMKDDEFTVWLQNRARADLQLPSTGTANLQPPSTNAANFQPPSTNAANLQSTVSPSQTYGQDISPTLAMDHSTGSFGIISFDSPTPLATGSNGQVNPPKKPRKTRSDKGMPRKKPPQLPGTSTFQAST